jgi:hypothetical protein
MSLSKTLTSPSDDLEVRRKNDLRLREAALDLGSASAEQFDRAIDPAKMARPYVANAA